tara:strand:- start:6077 stop:6652 length:576 start_codon:yes stop_codon:yes gene_type:complete
MEFSTNDALGKTWRQFNYMNYAWRSGYKEDVIVYCTHMDQIKIMWEAYKHFFDVDGEPIFYKEEGDHVVGVQDYYRNRTRDSLFDLFKTYLKPWPYIGSALPIAYSIIDIKDHWKGIDSKSRKNIFKFLTGTDLGDTRNFKSADELIYKTTQLASAETFIGPNCSWAGLCPYFDTEWVEIKAGWIYDAGNR